MYKSTFMGLNTALRGVLAHQNALDVTGHNISNISTDGLHAPARGARRPPRRGRTAAFNSQVVARPDRDGRRGAAPRAAARPVHRPERAPAARSPRRVAGLGRAAPAGGGGLRRAGRERPVGAAAEVLDHDGPGRVRSRTASRRARASRRPPQDLAQGFRQVDARPAPGPAPERRAAQPDRHRRQRHRAADRRRSTREIRDAIAHGQQPNDLLDTRDRLMDDLAKLDQLHVDRGGGRRRSRSTLGTHARQPRRSRGAGRLHRHHACRARHRVLDGDITARPRVRRRAAVGPRRRHHPGPARAARHAGRRASSGRSTPRTPTASTSTGAAGGDIFDSPRARRLRRSSWTRATTSPTNPSLIAAASSWAGAGEPGNGDNLAHDARHGAHRRAGRARRRERSRASTPRRSRRSGRRGDTAQRAASPTPTCSSTWRWAGATRSPASRWTRR